MEKTPPDRLAFLLRVDDAINWEGTGQSEKVVQRVSLPVDRIVCSNEHDLAAIVLRSQDLGSYRMQFCQLPRQLLRRRTLKRKGALILLGFPVDQVFTISEIKTPNAITNYFAARPTILTGTIAASPSKRLGSQYDPERDVLLNYQPSDPKMKPHGFSGAAVWSQRLARSTHLWTASPMIFGVQTAAFMTSRLLQVVGAPTVKEFLKNSWHLGK